MILVLYEIGRRKTPLMHPCSDISHHNNNVKHSKALEASIPINCIPQMLNRKWQFNKEHIKPDGTVFILLVATDKILSAFQDSLFLFIA